MNLSQLEYIISVDRHKHFGKAAKENFVTQPTLSMMIKKMEEEFNVLIFDRSKNPIKTTDIGRKIINQSKRIIHERDKLIDSIQDNKETINETFSLGIIPTLAPYLLPIFMPKFNRNYPNIKLQIIELTTDAILDKIRNNEIDVAILATPLLQEDIIEHELFSEEFYLYTDAIDPSKYILPSEIDIDRLMLLEEGHCLRSQVLNLCEMKEKQFGTLQYKIGSIETLMNLVDIGQGSTIIPQLAYDQLPAKKRKKVVSFQDPVPARTISIIHHFSFYREKFVEVLKKEVVSSLSKDYHCNKSLNILSI